MIIDGIPNRPLYFYQRDIIETNWLTPGIWWRCWATENCGATAGGPAMETSRRWRSRASCGCVWEKKWRKLRENIWGNLRKMRHNIFFCLGRFGKMRLKTMVMVDIWYFGHFKNHQIGGTYHIHCLFGAKGTDLQNMAEHMVLTYLHFWILGHSHWKKMWTLPGKIWDTIWLV